MNTIHLVGCQIGFSPMKILPKKDLKGVNMNINAEDRYLPKQQVLNIKKWIEANRHSVKVTKAEERVAWVSQITRIENILLISTNSIHIILQVTANIADVEFKYYLQATKTKVKECTKETLLKNLGYVK